MQLFVRSQQTHTLEVTGEESIAQIKSHVAEVESLATTDLAIYCSGRPLEDDMIVGQCASELATLEVEVRLLGGKVHGSLARAGKVKGQTPKVDKQEKKKKKTGRAKRRQQCKRRFGMATLMFGRRK